MRRLYCKAPRKQHKQISETFCYERKQIASQTKQLCDPPAPCDERQKNGSNGSKENENGTVSWEEEGEIFLREQIRLD